MAGEIVVQQERQDPPRPGGWTYLDVLYLVLFSIPANLLALAVCVAAFLLFDILPTGHFLTYAPLVAAAQLVWSVLIVSFIYALITIKYRLRFGPAIGWRNLDRPAAVYLLSGALLAVLGAATLYWLPTPAGGTPFDELIRDRTSLIAVALFGVLVAPAFEELVMRGFLFAAIDRPHGPLAAVLVTSAIFSLMHGWQYAWQWQSMLLLSCVGITFGSVRARTQSVAPSTLLHTGYNAALFAAVFAFGNELFRS